MEMDVFNKIKYSKLNDKEKIELAKLINDEIIRIQKDIGQSRINIDEDFLRRLINSDLFILLNIHYPNCIKLIDFKGFSFEGMNVAGLDFSYTNAEIDPQTVKDKSLYYTNLKGIDLSEKDFEGVFIEGANLEDTRANIDPQLVKGKSLYDTKLKGISLRKKSFNGVDIRKSDLRNTSSKIIISELKKNNNGEHPLYKTKLSDCIIYKGNTDTLLDNLYLYSNALKANIINPHKEEKIELEMKLMKEFWGLKK